MSQSAYWKTCWCGQSIVILNTRRGKRIAVNQQPTGHRAFAFRGVARVEELYIHGTHQPHLLTCTKPRPKKTEPKKKFV